MSSELKNLDMLEERVNQIQEVVRVLRQEKVELSARLKETEKELYQYQEQIAALSKPDQKTAEISRQLTLLQEERTEIRGRVSRMLETFSSIEELQPTGHPDN